jgi:hypothetical protein
MTEKRQKWDTVTRCKTPDETLCPVELWASIVLRIISYKGTNKNSPVLPMKQGNKIISITSDTILNLVRDGVEMIGKTKPGIF